MHLMMMPAPATKAKTTAAVAPDDTKSIEVLLGAAAALIGQFVHGQIWGAEASRSLEAAEQTIQELRQAQIDLQGQVARLQRAEAELEIELMDAQAELHARELG